MKIMFVDIDLSGHHISYMNALLQIPNIKKILVLPEKVDSFDEKQYVFKKIDFFDKKFFEYISWINEVYSIAQNEKPDVIHFLYGDVFYKYFGIGLEKFKKNFDVVLTLHGIRKGKLQQISLNRIFKYTRTGVVHTANAKECLKNLNIKNVVHIEYPHFAKDLENNSQKAKKYFGIISDKKVLGCLGGTRIDKGLDILLESLNYVEEDFELLIAGQENDITKEKITELSRAYNEKLHLMLKFLTDEEFEMAVLASDIIVLPYRKVFDGASGPLGEGVWKEKVVIGPSHGSLGSIITKNNIGYTFETENVNSLAQVLNKALKEDFKYNDVALKYKSYLSVERFISDYEMVYLK